MVKMVCKGQLYYLDVLEHLAIKTAIIASYGHNEVITCSSPCGVLQYKVDVNEQVRKNLSDSFKNKTKFYLSLLEINCYNKFTINRILKDKDYLKELNVIELDCVSPLLNRNIKTIQVC